MPPLDNSNEPESPHEFAAAMLALAQRLAAGALSLSDFRAQVLDVTCYFAARQHLAGQDTLRPAAKATSSR